MIYVFTESSHDPGTGGYFAANKIVSEVPDQKGPQMCPTKIVSNVSPSTTKQNHQKTLLEEAGTIATADHRNDDFSLKDHKMLPIFFLPRFIHTLGVHFKRGMSCSLCQISFKEISEFRSSSIHVRWAFGVV